MGEKEQMRRIRQSIDKLNKLNHNVRFDVIESSYSVEVACYGKKKDARYGAFETIQFFEDYVKPVGAYNTVRIFLEALLAGNKLTDQAAYHHFT